MDDSSIIHGWSMDYPCIFHGFPMDNSWIIHGLSMANLGYPLFLDIFSCGNIVRFEPNLEPRHPVREPRTLWSRNRHLGFRKIKSPTFNLPETQMEIPTPRTFSGNRCGLLGTEFGLPETHCQNTGPIGHNKTQKLYKTHKSRVFRKN